MYVHDLSTGIKRLHTFDLGCSAVMQVSHMKKLPQVIIRKFYGYSFGLMFIWKIMQIFGLAHFLFQFFYKLQSFTNPGTVYLCDLSSSDFSSEVISLLYNVTLH